jgi:RNA polymerase sigma-70 factor (ECF subfamily)
MEAGTIALSISDEELVARYVSTNDREALGELIERYSPRLRRLLYSLLGPHAEAIQDAEQEVYVALLKKLERFRGDSSFSTFFYALARNRIIDWMRRDRRLSDRTVAFENPDLVPGDAIDPLNTTVQCGEVAMLRRAMRRLKPDDQLLLYLKDGEGERIETLAEMTGTPVGTIKSRLARARRRVARAMEEMGYER